jgi:hypothetical protein
MKQLIALCLISFVGNTTLDESCFSHSEPLGGQNKVGSSEENSYYQIDDSEHHCSRFDTSFDLPNGVRYEIARVSVECIRYDGDSGYTAFTVRRISSKGGEVVEPFTVLSKGTFILFGANITEDQLFAYRLQQVGSALRISNVVMLSSGHTEAFDLPVAPGGYLFTYAKPTPDGKYCVLFDHGAVIVDLENETPPMRISFDPPLAYHEASPPDDKESDVGGFRLDGKYMNLSWKSDRNGILTVTDPSDRSTREIPVEIPSDG